MTVRALGAITLIFLVPSVAVGQDMCRPTETIFACWDRLDAENKARADSQSGQAQQEQKQVQKKTETGLEQLAGLGAGLKDFLPLLRLSGVLGPVKRDDKSGIVTIALNVPFLSGSGTVTKDPALQVKAMIDTSATLFEPLKTRLPAAGRDALETQLLGGSQNRENVQLESSYNFSSRRFGRNFNQHMPLLNRLLEETVVSIAPQTTKAGASIVALTAAVGQNVSLADTAWLEIPADARLKASSLLLAVVANEAALNAAFRKAMADSGLNLFGQLVNNQPQLYVTGSRTFRDHLFGPDLISGRVSFEMGLGNNLNAALASFDSRGCDVNAKSCLDGYTAFLKDPATRAAIKAGSRLSFYAEFVRNEDYHFTSADPALDLAMTSGTGWSAGFDYGRLIGVDDAGVAVGRVDTSFRWEAPADTTVDSRLVAALTITKKMGDVSIPFGLVYANKPKFLTGVDHGLGANIGLKFNLFQGLN